MPCFRLLGPLLACSLIAPVASARVGESEPELVARYGAVTSRQPARKSSQGQMHIYGERLVFRTPDWGVSAVMIGGRCEEINYTKAGDWTKVHFSYLLELNGGRASWTEQPTLNPAIRRDWQRRDKTMAWWGFTGFMIRTPAIDRALASMEKPAPENTARTPKN
jgi:hypothetical protein